MGLILTAFAIVAFKTPNHFAFGGTSGVSVILSTLFPTLPVGVFMWIINAVLAVLGFIFLDRKAIPVERLRLVCTFRLCFAV